jgi:O-antigen/teichoic acid export membrane protein
VPYFKILCVAGIAICLQGVNYQAIAAIGKSKAMFSWTLVKRAIGLSLIVGGLTAFGIKGLLVGMVIQSWLIYLINAYQVHKYIGYTFSKQLIDLFPTLVLSIVSWLAAYHVAFILPDWNMYIMAVIRLLFFIAIYIGVSLIFKIESLGLVKETVPMVLSKFNKKRK